MVIRDNIASWRTETIIFQQGSAFSPINFSVYISDIADRLTSQAYLFAGSAELMKPLNDIGKHKEL